jgi:hypothetical protein
MLRPFALRLPRALFFFSLRATFHLERPVVGGERGCQSGLKSATRLLVRRFKPVPFWFMV